jgi:mannose-6-phosphate isomerase-like protein (cupin superfamily)
VADGGSLASVRRQTIWPADKFPWFRPKQGGTSMTTPRALRIGLDELELLDRKVTQDGGALRYLEGARYGLRTSLFRSEIVPGSGPRPHRHTYNEIFVIEQGQAEYRVGDERITAGAGDIVVVPAGAPHGFVNTGTAKLLHLAIHEGAERAESEWVTFEDE